MADLSGVGGAFAEDRDGPRGGVGGVIGADRPAVLHIEETGRRREQIADRLEFHGIGRVEIGAQPAEGRLVGNAASNPRVVAGALAGVGEGTEERFVCGHRLEQAGHAVGQRGGRVGSEAFGVEAHDLGKGGEQVGLGGEVAIDGSQRHAGPIGGVLYGKIEVLGVLGQQRPHRLEDASAGIGRLLLAQRALVRPALGRWRLVN